MAGNVWEWTADWFGDYPIGGSIPDLNPLGPASGTERVHRGGQWFSSIPSTVRTTTRASVNPNLRDVVGFRCVMNGS